MAQMKTHKTTRSNLAEQVVEALDVGVFLVESTLDLILFANSAAASCLTAFDESCVRVPELLRPPILSMIEEASALPLRFTVARPVIAPSGRRFFLRCRRMTRGEQHSYLLTIAEATIREVDIKHILLSARFGLSLQESRVAFLASQGFRNREIAERLQIVEGTVKNYLTKVFSALSVRSRTELTAELGQLLDDHADTHRRD